MGAAAAHRAGVATSDLIGLRRLDAGFEHQDSWLGEVSPIEAIKDLRAKDVMAAAAAMTEDRFSG
ncbi:hypothetical protein E3O11_09700 [Cryobacterium levicorallinum]|uniref:Uncharacterized protein n=1 Tax=Cryobacterium levicorallinum TaxID=995038 RepID=A0A4V3IAQ3_9MICO|nr:hypothetical protein [Cryobacterium levicorallinum]TFB84539.1 hypothetical protein E3O11_09700 [Cryobacterium levicorallinum]GEP28427.1 hypothetical protein CLE01_30250 [Cryobacterium levicorallinum]